MILKRWMIGLFLALASFGVKAQETGLKTQEGPEASPIGIDEKLGNHLPLDLRFTDQDGNEVLLKDLMDRPTLLTLVYYRCPGICSPLLEALAKAVDGMTLTPGKEFRLVTISFDPTETPDLAEKKRVNYMKTMRKPPSKEGWTWLTGNSEAINAITELTGFRYKKEENGDYIHSGAVMAISPTGKLCRYLYGIRYLPFDLQMAVAEAQDEKTGPTIAKFLQYCFSYDPQGKRYVLDVTRIIGTIMLMVLGIFLLFLVYGGKKTPAISSEPEVVSESEKG